VPIVLKSGNLNLLETSGPVQACNGTALPLPLPLTSIKGYEKFFYVLFFNVPNFSITFFSFILAH
jgi:hypothetical protein